MANEAEHAPSVLFLAERMYVGGAERYFIDKAAAMRRRGCRVALASAGGAMEAEITRRGLTHVRLRMDIINPPSITPGNLAEDIRDLTALIDELEAPVIDCMAGVPFMLASVLRETRRLPVVYEVLAPRGGVIADLIPALRRLAAEGGFFATTPHDAEYQESVAGLPAGTARVIPIGTDLGRFRPLPKEPSRAGAGLPSDRLVVLTACRLDPGKGEYVVPLMDALEGMLAEHPRLYLLILGDGSLRPALQAQAHGRRLPVAFVGVREDMPEWYGMADVYVGQGMTALEAAACGLPVVLTYFPPHQATSVGYWGEDAYGSTGGPFPGSRWHDFPSLLKPLLADPEFRRRQGEANRRRMETSYAQEPLMDRWFDVFRDFAARAAGGGVTPAGLAVAQ